ncbi:unnamed protein product [Rhizophagus irregularis]|nr:unnamed protein product [Rhizophagus irregularis]
MFLYNYLSNIVYSDNIERSRKPTQPIPSPIPQQQQQHHHHHQQYYYYSSTYSNFHNHTTSAYAAATMNSPNNKYSSNKLLKIGETCSTEELRRAYISRSRICHPDKFPEYPKATEAFQKLSYSYETLNKPSSRRAYDMGTSELLFLDGDFEMIRALVNDAIETLEIAFRRMRDLLLAGKKYVKIVQFELIRLYELQQQLRSLSYFDVFGRLRLTMQLTKISLTIPMLIDNAMKAESDALGNYP